MKRIWIAILLLTGPVLASPVQVQAEKVQYAPMDFSHLLGMKGFGDDLLKLHFQLYNGYVKNINLLLDMLANKSMSDPAQVYDFGALKRRIGWEFDGMRLHELYFGNLGGTGAPDTKAPLYQKIGAQFGSFKKWKEDFISTGSMRGIGWVILYQDLQSGQLINVWVEEHDFGHLAGATPLLVMDVWEHAYITQYGLDRAKYIDAFFSNIDWNVVNQRQVNGH